MALNEGQNINTVDFKTVMVLRSSQDKVVLGRGGQCAVYKGSELWKQRGNDHPALLIKKLLSSWANVLLVSLTSQLDAMLVDLTTLVFVPQFLKS